MTLIVKPVRKFSREVTPCLEESIKVLQDPTRQRIFIYGQRAWLSNFKAFR